MRGRKIGDEQYKRVAHFYRFARCSDMQAIEIIKKKFVLLMTTR